MTPDSLIAIIFILIGIIATLVGGHYVTVVWEQRKSRQEISDLRDEMRKEIGEVKDKIAQAALEVAKAATAAAQVAQNFMGKK